ncbi:MAG: FAD-dependent oxidoreductase [Nanoarchaeota archaeon]
MKQKQIAVIGAGPGGLAAAVEIASKHPDDKVILIEEQNHVGGLAQAWLSKIPITNGKYQGQTLYVRKELTHAVANMNKGGRIYEHLTSLGVDMDSIPFAAARKFAQLISLDNYQQEDKPLKILNNWREMQQYLMAMALSPKEGKRMKKYFRFIDSLIEERYPQPNSTKANLEEKLLPFLDESFLKPLAFLGKGAALLYTKPNFIFNCFKTYDQLLDGFFKGFTREEDIKATLNMLFGYWGLPSQKASGLFASLVHIDYWEGGGPLAPETTSFQTLSEKIAEALTNNYHGEVLTRTKAVKVRVKDGTVFGVKVKPKGKEAYDLEADCVIFAGDPQRTTLSLLEGHLPKSYVEKIKSYEMSISLTGSYILTDLPLHQMKDQLDYAANVLVSSYAALKQDNGDNTPENFVYYVAVPTLREKAGLI